MMNMYVSPTRQKTFDLIPKNISPSPCHYKTSSLKQCKSDVKVGIPQIDFYNKLSKYRESLLNNITTRPIRRVDERMNEMPAIHKDLLSKIKARLPRLITTPLRKIRGVRINQQKDLEKAYSLRIYHRRAFSLKPQEP